ncbi:molybdate ABC transporter substrate-binding protein [Aureivirga sp. CE67]|uniref:molybdate ABC transporter substrate-binding protein n=1 Tax=Aureivirga sp. CE67 TaxID=1788983 RepID=UPI0018CB2230|nr:molybdate ABC transporter substrate-binding protein [Aureivirga sp. CE67]
MLKKIFFLFTILTVLIGCNSKPEKKELLVAVAANMQYAMKEIGEEFTKKTKIPVEYIVSSSGKLTAQITAGAPYDIFISANKKFPEALEKENKILGKQKTFAFGKLILWTKEDFKPSLEILSSDKVKKIALANPKTAPYGEAAKQVLQNLNLLGELKSKLVFGESVAQTNQFIDTKSATLGFTAFSTIHIPNKTEKGNWFLIPEKYYNPIEQTVVVLKGKKEKEAEQFYDFLSSDIAKEILKQNGYN